MSEGVFGGEDLPKKGLCITAQGLVPSAKKSNPTWPLSLGPEIKFNMNIIVINNINTNININITIDINIHILNPRSWSSGIPANRAALPRASPKPILHGNVT